MRIVAITAGAANMYCGSCLRDNALAAELLRLGHDVTLLPIYTPTRTDEPNVSERRVLFGGINVYLQQVAPFFRHTPRLLDRLFDSSPVMAILGKLSVATDPAKLGPMTLSTLRGENGFQKKEIKKLLDWLLTQPTPDVVILPNSLLIGFARPIVERLRCPVVCTLQGEDLFLDGLPDADRREALALIREQTRFVDGFVAVSDYYADFMAQLLAIADDKMFVVPLGINLEGYERASFPETSPLKIGYFARIAPEKGLHNLVAAYRRLRRRPGVPETRLEVAGYLGREHRGYLAKLEKLLAEDGLSGEFHYHGTLDRQGKIDFLRSLAVASVPTDYEEPKGMFLLEAMACGVPVVQPRRGAFAELLAKTGGGRLVPPGDHERLALELEDLLVDSEARRELGRNAFDGVRRHYSVTQMAKSMESVLERLVGRESLEERETMTLGVATH